MVETKFDPFGADAMDQVQTILNTAEGAQPNTTLSDATISMVGTTPMYSAIRNYYDHDLRLIIILTLVVVFLILVALLRAIVAPLYLIASVVISYLSALGLGLPLPVCPARRRTWNVRPLPSSCWSPRSVRTTPCC